MNQTVALQLLSTISMGFCSLPFITACNQEDKPTLPEQRPSNLANVPVEDVGESKEESKDDPKTTELDREQLIEQSQLWGHWYSWDDVHRCGHAVEVDT